MAERRNWEIPPLEEPAALDIAEAVKRAGGEARVTPAVAEDRYRVGVLSLPDVGCFLRALASVGIAARVLYSAGSGWHFDFDSEGS